MATLNQIAYNIKGLMSGGDESVESSIDTRQIKHWIHYHRAKIIEEKMLGGSPIDRRWIQPMISRNLSTPTFDAEGRFVANVVETSNVVGNQNYHTNSINFTTLGTQGFSNSEYYGNDYHDENEFNYYSSTINIPHTINVGQNDGITDVRLKKIIRLGAGQVTGRWSSWNKLLVKTKDEATFGWANKFANIKTPYVVPYNSLDKMMFLEISGLRYLVSQTSLALYYEYWIDMHGILTDPTESVKYTNTSNDIHQYQNFNDSSSYYPMSEEDLPLLVSRVAEVEMNLVLKTPIDLAEDNVDTSKISMGGGQQQQ